MTYQPPVFPDNFNMADYFVFSNIEAGRSEKTAILFEGAAITYRAVADKVMRVARGLVGDGLLPEQRVLICMQDRPEFAYAWYGAIKAGAVATQINPLLPASDYEYYLDYVKPQFVFVDEQSLPEFEKALRNTRHCGRGLGQDNVIVVGRDNAGHQSFDSWIEREPKDGADPWPTRKDDPAVWLFTSGTTGQSKGAVHTHTHFPFNTEVYAKDFIGIQESDVTISGARLFFGYATGTNLMFPFAVGATALLFREQPTPELLFELIAKHKATVFTSVPTLINKMLQAPQEQRLDISTVRLMWSAGEALPLDLHDRWNRAFGVPIIDGIGSAESFHIYISNRPGHVRPGSLGKLVPGYEAKLADDDGNLVAQGDVGTLWLKGDSAAQMLLRFLVSPVIVERGGIPLEPQRSHIALRDEIAVVIGELGLIAGHKLTQAPGSNVSQTVTDINVETFCAADAVDDRYAERAVPAIMQIERQRFTGAPHQTDGGNIAALLLRGLQHFVD